MYTLTLLSSTLPDWVFARWSVIGITVLSTIAVYAAIVVITRLNGLRTFAKMGSFDFAITIAIGSLIATILLNTDRSLVQGITGLVVLIFLQATVAFFRKRSNRFEQAITNTPVLLMENGEILEGNLDATRVTESDLYAKLREANVTDFSQVLAVVLETTGDISVLHSEEPNAQLDRELLKYVDVRKR